MRATKKQPLKSLPDDPEKLKSIIMELSSRVAALEEFVLLGRAKKYGASSEKSIDQREMFNEAELSVVAEEVLAEQEAEREAQANTTPVKPKKKSGRKPLPATLPRVRIEHSVPETEQVCDCGCQRVEIGEVTSEQLDIIPAKVQVIVNVRKKYACKHCESGLITAPLPPQPIPKSNASPGLLAHVATATQHPCKLDD